MAAETFDFHHGWEVAATPSDVYDVLADVASYPRWWPQVSWVERIDDESGHVGCRSLLPYTLSLTLRATRREPDRGLLEVAVTGDLDGSCRWTIRPTVTGARVDFHQRVRVRGRVLRVATRWGRPLLVANHSWMMRGARRGLREVLAGSLSVCGRGPEHGR